MGLLFGQVSTQGPEARVTSAPPPCPEFSGQQLAKAACSGFEFGIWLPPEISAREAVFVAEPERQLACVCDPEIGNFDEILREAAAGGAELKERTQAEAIAWLVRLRGEAAFGRLSGGFACVIWDRGQVWLATDRFSMKRLNYSIGEDGIRFASRVRWLRDHHELNLKAIHQYLDFSFIPTPETVFQRVHKLPGGGFVHVKDGCVRQGSYWEMSYPENLDEPEDTLSGKLRQQFHEAVARTTSGLNPQTLGCYLSGGTDSSTVLGMARDVLGSAPPAFSIGFAEETFSELAYARLAAKHFGAAHHEYVVTADDGWRALQNLLRAFDEPFANPSAIGGYVCAEFAASKGVAVMLAGDGGDELFGGNERYRKDVIFSRIQKLPGFVVHNPLLGLCFRATSGWAQSNRLQNILKRAAMNNPERFYVEDCLSADLANDVLSPELGRVALQHQPLEIVRSYYSQANAHSELNRLLFIDLKLTIGDNDLVKVRESAAACGVRVRFPMLDEMLAEFSGAMPARLKVKGLEKRYLFKHALRGFLPEAVITKKKHGFGVPVSVWFRKDSRFRQLLLDTITDRTTAERGFYRHERLQQIVDEHMRDYRDWGQLLWAILMLELSLRELAHER